jgi:uncharacterized protein (DUF2141 family)
MLLACLFWCWSTFARSEASLSVVVTQLEDAQAPIRLALFANEAGFLQDSKALYGLTLLPASNGKEALGRLEKIPFGTYALAVYQDLDRNGKLNKNKLGIPSEPYGFSNNVKVKWRSPKFQEAAFQVGKNGQELKVVLMRWSER